MATLGEGGLGDRDSPDFRLIVVVSMLTYFLGNSSGLCSFYIVSGHILVLAFYIHVHTSIYVSPQANKWVVAAEVRKSQGKTYLTKSNSVTGVTSTAGRPLGSRAHLRLEVYIHHHQRG